MGHGAPHLRKVWCGPHEHDPGVARRAPRAPRRGARARAAPRARARPRSGARPGARQRVQLQRGRRLLRPLPHHRSAAARTRSAWSAPAWSTRWARARERWLGRRVSACAIGAIGAHAECALVDPAMTFDAPDALDDVAACAFFFPFHVAWLALFERGRCTGRVAARARRRGRRGLGRGAARRRARRARDRDGRLRREARVLPRARRRGRDRLPERRPRGRAARRDGGRGRRRGVRPRRRRHHARDDARDGARRPARDGGLLRRDRGRGPGAASRRARSCSATSRSAA